MSPFIHQRQTQRVYSIGIAILEETHDIHPARAFVPHTRDCRGPPVVEASEFRAYDARGLSAGEINARLHDSGVGL